MTREQQGRVRTVLAWCGALLYPPLMIAAVPVGPTFRSDGSVVVLAGALTVLCVGLLRRRPLVALVLLLLGSAGAGASHSVWAVTYLLLFVDDAAVAYIVATRSRRTGIVAVVLTFLVQLFNTSRDSSPLSSAAIPALALLAAWLLGYSVRERREHTAELAARASEQAVTAERLRIARELHDMIAHSIGVIAIQAGVGSRVIDTQPAEARNALTTIEATSRETLAGLRRTLGALRRTDRGAGDGGGESVPLDPTPGLADLDRLIASTRDAGVRADVEWLGERRELAADIDLAAFRIVQEALTNVVRHAGTRECRVTVDARDPAELALSVVDEGKGGLVSTTGFGLIGMRERVALLDGEFTAGPRPEGGFRVAVRLPVPAGIEVGR
ncbi:sensor histidine kinase [Streptomyces beijiangensis]|uniref:histidine kinase n=2 Tax=Streptomyces beijiangensis TaxID=163361 RepID=A0A939F836_9ACTN|nr:sensor histidine kinase [Streptomyces beijiangensis]